MNVDARYTLLCFGTHEPPHSNIVKRNYYWEHPLQLIQLIFELVRVEDGIGPILTILRNSRIPGAQQP